MGLMGGLMGVLFGNGRNTLQETVQIFRENAEEGAKRSAEVQMEALRQHAAEFKIPRKGWFDRLIDGLNRLPRPMLALGTLALFISAMTEPVWFAERMQGIALVPEPLWWLLGVIVSFYFGARHQVKSQNFQREIAETMSRVPQVVKNIETLRTLRSDDKGVADTGTDAPLSLASLRPDANPALEEWRKTTV